MTILIILANPNCSEDFIQQSSETICRSVNGVGNGHAERVGEMFKAEESEDICDYKASYNVHVQSNLANNSCNRFNFVIDFFFDPVLKIHNLIRALKFFNWACNTFLFC